MVKRINALRIRNFLGLVTLVLGIVAAILSVSLGIVGLVMYFVHGDLFWLENPGAGPGVALTIIIEGFFLELALALSTIFFGYVIKGSLRPSLNALRKAKSKLMSSGWKDDSEEDGGMEGSPREKHQPWHRLEKLKKGFEVKAPKCLWISLLLLAGMNLGLCLTCYVLAGGNGPAGMGLAMRRYGTDPAVRRAVDWVQQSGECCGEQEYSEWLSLQWCTERPSLVPSEVGPPGYPCGPKHRSVKNDVPQSCCSPPRSPCIHDPLDLLGLGPLHNEGCSQYIEDTLGPKYIGVAKFHLFLCAYKLLLVGLVLLLRPKEASSSEKATDEEAKGLIDPEATSGKKAGGGAGLRAKPSTKSWFSGRSMKSKPPEAAEEELPPPSPKEGEQRAGVKPKEEPSKKRAWFSAIKGPLRKMSRVVARVEDNPGGTTQSRSPAAEAEGAEMHEAAALSERALATASEVEGRTAAGDTSPARTARSVSQEMKERGLELRRSTVSRARSVEEGPKNPHPFVRGSFSEWRRPSVDAGGGGSSSEQNRLPGQAAQIAPSRHQEHRLGVVH